MERGFAKYRFAFAALVLASAAVHLYVAQSTFGFTFDMQTFASWGRRMATMGAAQFYANGYWCDYPPGYIVILGMLHQLASAINANEGSVPWLIIMKFPACLSDCVTGWLVWRIAKRELAGRPHGNAWSLIAAAAYLFNPAVIIDSALWGQVDGVLALFVVAMFACYRQAFAARNDARIAAWMIAGSVLWAVGITMKLQGALIAPAVFVVFFLLIRRNARVGLVAMLGSVGAALCVALVVLIPFSPVVGMRSLLQNFLQTLGSYKYGSVNALNFFTMVGAGWKDQELPFMFLTYRTWGTIFLVLLVAFVFACYVRAEYSIAIKRVVFGYEAGEGGQGSRFESLSPLSSSLVALPILLAAVLVVGFFTFSVRVHERYVLYAISMLLVAAVLYRDWHLAGIFVLVSAIEAVNLITVFNGAYFMGTSYFEVVAGAFTVATCLWLFVRTWQLSARRVKRTSSS